MIVRQFLHWLRTAPAGDRADATSALARAYLYSDLSPDDRAAAEGAMLLLLDDPSPLVRKAMADTFASSQAAPAAIVLGLACDQPDVAAPVLQRSPLLLDTDLVDIVATARPDAQIAVARRALLPRSVSAAIAEVGSAEACLVLVESRNADVAPFSLDRIVARHGHLAAIREALLTREDLPATTRQNLIAKLSNTLADFVTSRAWLEEERARRVVREACEKATVALAADTDSEARPLIRHLRETAQLTAGLILRALLSGNVTLFEEALADLSGMPLDRVVGLIHDKGGAGFRALYDKAGLPASTYPAFREAVTAMREGDCSELGGGARLKRRMIERVLTRCEENVIGDIEPLMTLLRRFATEAARDEAKLFCEELVARDGVEANQNYRLAAA
jgi:uncharacterized protein (DUF2336 family)